MRIPAEMAKAFAEFPPALRELVVAELAAGNAIVAIEHGFPAAPCGASIKLAQAVAAERRVSAGDVHFYARNSSLYAGEFTTESRHFFVLEPPLPPEPEPDMDAIRQALDNASRTPPPARAQTPARDPLPEIPDTPHPGPHVKPIQTTRHEPSRSSDRALITTETAMGVTRQLYFQDRLPPHEIQFGLERRLMTLFQATVIDGILTLNATANVVGARYDFELRFEAALPLENAYSLRVATSWATQAPANHTYYRQTAESWFSHWTGDFTPGNPPPAEVGTSARYEKICAASLHAEAHLDSIPAIQQTILAEMKRGATFATSHKEGGSKIFWRHGHFARSDYGDYPGDRTFASDEEFLHFLRQYFDWETTRNSPPGEDREYTAWKLILRLMRR